MRPPALLTLALALGACGGRVTASAPPESLGSKLSADEMQRIVAETAAARQLEQRRPVRIEALSPSDFTARLLDAEGREASDGPSDGELYTLLGFNLVPAPEARAAVSKVDDVLAEQVVGF